MAIYEPVDVGATIKASASDLFAFRWDTNGVEADFLIPDDDTHLISVRFGGECIVRILDEMPLSTEDDGGADIGLVPDHFAYRVKDAVFERTQSLAWKEINGEPTHYRFVTGWACMDVLSKAEPAFTVITRPKAD